MKKIKEKAPERLRKILLVILGNAVVAFGVCYFILPMNFIMGGVTGLGLIFSHYFSMDISILTYIVNILFFIVGFIFMGKEFAFGIVISTVTYPTFLYIYRKIPNLTYSGDDVMLALVFAAIVMGIGDGLILKNGASSGGVEVLSCVINKKTGIKLALLINCVDMIILFIQLFYSSVEQILYGILLTMALSFVLDKVLVMGGKRNQVTIISPEHAKIREAILSDLDLGCSMLKMETGFVGKPMEAVMCVLPRNKLQSLYNMVLDFDKEAFIVTCEVSNVKGRGFSVPKMWKEKN